jgi:hypothetical protein
MNQKELLHDFKDPDVRKVLRTEMNRINPDAYDKQSYDFIMAGIAILGEMIFLNKHGAFKGMPRSRRNFFSEYFDDEHFSRGIHSMVRSGVFYSIEQATAHLMGYSGHFMERPVLVEYVRMYLKWMIAYKQLDSDSGGCQAGPMGGFDFSAVR